MDKISFMLIIKRLFRIEIIVLLLFKGLDYIILSFKRYQQHHHHQQNIISFGITLTVYTYISKAPDTLRETIGILLINRIFNYCFVILTLEVIP